MPCNCYAPATVMPLQLSRSCMQPMLQDPVAVLKVADTWNTFKKGLGAVLTDLARSPATVAAVRTSTSSSNPTSTTTVTPAAAATAVPNGASGGEEAEAEAAEAAASMQQGVTQCYLSSYKLFGLQLADSAFRRGFLVQVRHHDIIPFSMIPLSPPAPSHALMCMRQLSASWHWPAWAS